MVWNKKARRYTLNQFKELERLGLIKYTQEMVRKAARIEKEKQFERDAQYFNIRVFSKLHKRRGSGPGDGWDSKHNKLLFEKIAAGIGRLDNAINVLRAFRGLGPKKQAWNPYG